MDEFVERWG